MLAAVLAAGCGGETGADRGDPEAVAEAYAVADHELDDVTVYDLLGPEALDGADRDEWIEQQRQQRQETGPHAFRHRDDTCHDRQTQPREVADVTTRDLGDVDSPGAPPGLYAVRVIVEFADGDTLQCSYGLREADGRYEVVSTWD